MFTTSCRVNWFDPVFIDLSIFFLLSFPIESMLPEQTLIWVGLVISPTVQVFEHVWTQFPFLCFKSRGVHFFVYIATPSKFTMVFQFVRTIVLDTLRFLYSVRECCMVPLPAVFILGYSQIHVSTPNCYDSKLKGLSNELTLVLSNTRELDRVPSTK